MQSRIEELLQAIIDGKSASELQPAQSRMEQQFIDIITGGHLSGTPQSRAEALLAQIQSGGGGRGGSILSGTTPPTSDMGSDGELYLLTNPATLPAEYQAVKHIYFPGTSYRQYIVIGHMRPTTDYGPTIINMAITVPEGATQPSDGYLLAVHAIGNMSNTDDCGILLPNDNALSFWARNAQYKLVPEINNGILYLSNGGYSVKQAIHPGSKDIIRAVVPISTRVDRGMVVGNYNGYSGEATHSTIFMLHSLAFLDADGTPYAYYQPCYRIADDVIGLYDVIGRAFYPAFDSTVLTAGQNTAMPEYVFSAYAKVAGAWRGLPLTDIEDINVSSGA